MEGLCGAKRRVLISQNKYQETRLSTCPDGWYLSFSVSHCVRCIGHPIEEVLHLSAYDNLTFIWVALSGRRWSGTPFKGWDDSVATFSRGTMWCCKYKGLPV
ncbi:hypothetical protein CDAR_316541 [Caerostris darwini]|uniref:Uncharacterized protein n=1 Tax=Caerostris darwini TaxID=1538125 RepID=A0AAV4UJ96_9ARAC|nr:hypothetical protein CDAR_316541 [Caerostris darwini]